MSLDYITLFECTIKFFWRFDHMNLAFLTRVPRISSLAALVLVGAVLAAPGLANAGVISFSFANQTPVTSAGGTGTIDVVITETGTQDTLYQFQVEAFLAQHGGSNISLNAALETGDSGSSWLGRWIRWRHERLRIRPEYLQQLG